MGVGGSPCEPSADRWIDGPLDLRVRQLYERRHPIGAYAVRDHAPLQEVRGIAPHQVVHKPARGVSKGLAGGSRENAREMARGSSEVVGGRPHMVLPSCIASWLYNHAGVRVASLATYITSLHCRRRDWAPRHHCPAEGRGRGVNSHARIPPSSQIPRPSFIPLVPDPPAWRAHPTRTTRASGASTCTARGRT